MNATIQSRLGGLQTKAIIVGLAALVVCLLGALVQFGWEKALGGYDEELEWWERQAVLAVPLLA